MNEERKKAKVKEAKRREEAKRQEEEERETMRKEEAKRGEGRAVREPSGGGVSRGANTREPAETNGEEREETSAVRPHYLHGSQHAGGGGGGGQAGGRAVNGVKRGGGDWPCAVPGCGHVNLARHYYCSKCKTPRKREQRGARREEARREGARREGEAEGTRGEGGGEGAGRRRVFPRSGQRTLTRSLLPMASPRRLHGRGPLSPPTPPSNDGSTIASRSSRFESLLRWGEGGEKLRWGEGGEKRTNTLREEEER